MNSAFIHIIFMHDVFMHARIHEYCIHANNSHEYCLDLRHLGVTDELIANILNRATSKDVFKNTHLFENLNYENLQCKIMYASKKYLNMMEKEQAKSYLKARREGSLFKYNSKIMKELRKKQK